MDANTGRVNEEASGCSERKNACAGGFSGTCQVFTRSITSSVTLSAEPTVRVEEVREQGDQGRLGPLVAQHAARR